MNIKHIKGEVWKPFPMQGYFNYLISNMGRVYSRTTQKEMALAVHHKGYLKAQVSYLNKHKGFFVHRLVALAFLDNPNNYAQVNHINGIKADNRFENLEWCTQSMNKKHAFAIGLECNKGENHPSSKLTTNEVLSIRKLFKKGHTRRMLAEQFGTKPSNIKDIVLRRSWKHI